MSDVYYGYAGRCTSRTYAVAVDETSGPELSGRHFYVQVSVPAHEKDVVYVSSGGDSSADRLPVGASAAINADRAVDIAEDFVRRRYGRTE